MNKIEINECVFKKVISAVKHTVARDDSRPILKYIQLNVSGNKLVVVSLDGYRASRITVDLGTIDCESFTCYIKPINIKTSKNGVFPVIVEADDDIAYVEVITEYGKLKYSFTQPKSEYVDIEKIYKDAREHDREVAINDFSAKLENLIERAPTTKKEVTAIKGRLTLYTNKTLRAIKNMKVVIDRELNKLAVELDTLNKINMAEVKDEVTK